MKKKVNFAYFKPLTYSGQSAASVLIVEELVKRGWECSVIPVYPLERGAGSRIKSYAIFISKQLITALRFVRLLGERNPILHLNLGQGFGSFIRFGLPYFPIRLLKPSMRVVVSLHGSVFMEWHKSKLVTRIFLIFLKSAELITVLGDKQKSRLVQLGVQENKITILPNACELDIATEEQLADKHKDPEEICVLHLSLLIESKGFPLYLEALGQLALSDLEKPVRAVLCGPMAVTSYCKELDTSAKKERWIINKIDSINSQGRGKVSVRWIPGATGREKQALFEKAHIFVFPSRFPVEAQPLVLLEAMASGCAIITSDVGEIPSTLSNVYATTLTELSAENLVKEMKKLILSDELRLEMAVSGRQAMLSTFSIQHYADRWEEIFSRLGDLER